jgi:hypothetical protein
MPHSPDRHLRRAHESALGVVSAVAGCCLFSLACTGVISPPGNTPAGTSTGVAGTSGSATGNSGSTGSGPGSAGSGVTTGVAGTGVATGAGGTVGTAGTTGVADPFATACAASNGALNAGVTPVRRLTRDQFNNTVRDLIGATGMPADALGLDEKIGPFASNAIAPVDETLVQQHQEVAATLATAAKPRMTTISPCNLTTDTGTTCATQFVTQFGQKAYRRPLTSAEVQTYVSLYTLGKTGLDAANGFRLVIEAMLQSPFFLYHHDVGSTGTPQAGTIKVTPFELASRLSYFIWNTMPDDTLFAVASNGTLADEAVLTAQVQRMLTSDKAAPTIALFHRQWLDVTELPEQVKSATVYPRYNAALGDAMMSELAMFTDHVVRKGDGLFKTLMTSNLAFPQGGLFGIYGVTQPSGFTVGSSVTLNASQRAGILTQAAFLTRWAHGDQTSPVHRGKLVRLNVLCGYVPPPPANANTNPPPPTPTTSTRERFAQHDADPTCGNCHQLMDPIGLGFENFDGIGAWRTMDGLGAVDATGNIVAVGPDLAGTFNGAVELANKLASSQEVSNCFANQWFRFSMGRMESTNDACSIKGIRDAFRTSGGNIRELISRVVLSPAFRNVRLTGG